MDDQQIIDLYWERSETAISETDRKYGKYCHYIAYSILRDRADCDECVNDTYFRAWEAMPPHRPGHLAAFLGRITRNLSLDRRRYQDTEKRRMDRVAVSLEELQECVPSVGSPEDVIDEMALGEIINQFLSTLSEEACDIFMRRYWYMNAVKEIAGDFGISESKVKTSLLRSRRKLKQFLEEEGIVL